jgi:hypothetical protein
MPSACSTKVGYLRREEAFGIIRALAKTGTPIKEIVRRTGRSRKLVRDIVRGGAGDVFRYRSNVLEPHLAWLSGRPAAAMAPSCGGGFRRQPAFVAVFVLSPNGRHVAAVPKAPDARGYESRRQPGC